MHVINYPHPTLRHASKPLKRVDAELQAIIRQMFELMYANHGMGLAANQVDLPYRLFIVNPTGDPDDKDEELVLINPVLSSPKGSDEGEEGCLSIPHVYAPVKRASRITINAYNERGEELHGDAEGLLARVFQHEVDHLDGKLFIDRLSPLALAEVRGSLGQLEAQFERQRARGEIAGDAQIAARLAELERLRT